MRNAFFRLIAALVCFGVAIGMIFAAILVRNVPLGTYSCGAVIVAGSWVCWELLFNHDDL
jgi:hypothetical protein